MANNNYFEAREFFWRECQFASDIFSMSPKSNLGLHVDSKTFDGEYLSLQDLIFSVIYI